MRDSEPKLPIHCSRPPTTNTTALGTGMGKKNGDMFEGSIGSPGDAIILLILDIYFIRRRVYNLLSASY